MIAYLEKWINNLTIENKSNLTIKAYRESIELLFSHLELELNLIDKSDIRDFIGHRVDNGISNSTIRKNIAGIKSYFSFLFENKLIQENPTIDIKIKKEGSKLPNFHSIDTMNKVLENTTPINQKYKKNWIRDLALVEIAYSSGLRLEELHNLEINRINQELKLIRVIGKGNKERIIPLGSKAINALNNWLSIRKKIFEKYKNISHDYVFTTTTGRQLSRTQIGDRIKHLFKSNGITQKSNPHVLRHSFATHLLSNKVGIRDIQEMLGHTSLNTTQIYTFVDSTLLKEEYSANHPRAQKKEGTP